MFASDPLNLQDAYRIALENNPDFLTLGEGIEIAELDLEIARAAFQTRVRSLLSSDARSGAEVGSSYSLSLDRDLETGSNVSLGVLSSSFDDSALSELRLQYSRPLFPDPLNTGTFQLEQSTLDVEASQTLHRIGAEELLIQVARSYYASVLAARAIEVQRRASEAAETLHQATLANLEAGRASRLDVSRSELFSAQATQLLNDAIDRHSRLQDDLRHLLSLPFDQPLMLDETLEGAEHSYATDPLGESSMAIYLENNLELEHHRRQLHRLRRETLLRSQDNPDIELSVHFALVGEGDDFEDSFDLDDERFGIGLAVNGDRNRSTRSAEYRKAALALNSAERDYLKARDKAAIGLRNSRRETRQAVESLALAEKSRAFAQKQFEQYQLLYGQGKANTTDILDAQRDLAQAEYQLLEARVRYQLSRLHYEKAHNMLAQGWDIPD